MRHERIGSYRIERPLGSGAFATVWLAADELLDDRVAIKVLADNWSRNPEMRSRFIDEAKILRRIDDVRIVRVHQIGLLADDRPYFVMSWADRGTLHDRLNRQRRAGSLIDVDTAMLYISELAACLQVVHDFGVVHRDIKPSNILFRSLAHHHRTARSALGDEQVLLGDFGLAKHLARGTGFTLAAGTPAYMAPEQARAGSDLDQRADLFAATAVAFELLTGRAPFSAETLGDVARGARTGDVPRLHELRAGLPSRLQDVIDRGLQVRPADRFDSAAEFAAELWAAVGTHRGSVLPQPAPAPPPRDEEPTDGLSTLVKQMESYASSAAARGRIAEAAARLTAPLSVAIIGPHPGLEALTAAIRDKAGGELSVRASADPAAARRSDAVLVAVDGPSDEVTDRVNQLGATLRETPAGPVLALGFSPAAGCGTNGAAAVDPTDRDAALRRSLSGFVSLASGGNGLAVVDWLRGPRATDVRRSAVLALLESALRLDDPGLRSARRQLIERLDAIGLDTPVHEQLQVLRDEVAGRVSMSQPQRDELRRVLGPGDIDRKLGLLSGSALDERAIEARRGVERWRTMANTGRIPFSSRRAAAVVERTYDQLWVVATG